ncbi:MAG: hypothetical protein JEZ05_06265 [Tenericutes bacterium]|nr:hypothetical protein [Mycoplasmatota bacterium]
MASIISKVTELDKLMRNKVKELEGKREKLPEFLREQKKELINKYELESKREIEARKAEIEKSLSEAIKSSEKELKESLVEIEESYKENKDKWVEQIYKQCVDDYTGE